MPWVRVGKRTINIDNIAHFVVEQEDVVQISMVGDADRAPIRLIGEEARALKKFIERGELGEIKRVFVPPAEGAGPDDSRASKKRPAKGAKNGRSAPHVVL
jgi:hypothetical protein